MNKTLKIIPRFLNTPDKLAFWTWNEFALFILVLCIISLMGSMLLGLFLGALSVQVLKNIQDSQYGDLTKGGFYWSTPFSKKWYQSIPASNIREFVG